MTAPTVFELELPYQSPPLSPSAFELLHPRAGNAEHFRDLAVAHGLPHLADRLAGDVRVLARESLRLGLGFLCSRDPLHRVGNFPNGVRGAHVATV